MQKFLFDKEIVDNQMSVLNSTLNSQRQTKKTLLSYLEKFSNAMYDNFNSESTDLLLALINEAHSVFECIKSNISKTLELKKFLENISQSAFLNTIDSEKFNLEFKILLENVSKTNSNYLVFMNNYENFVNQNLKDSIIESITKTDIKQTTSIPFEEEASSTPINLEQKTTSESSKTDTTTEVINTIPELETSKESINTSNENEGVQENTEVTISSENTDINNEVEKIHESTNAISEISISKESIKANNKIEKTQESTSSVSEVDISKETFKTDTINNQNIEPESATQTIEENVDESSEEENTIDETFFSTYLQEKVLIINRKSGIAILPYSISDLDELFLDNPEKYSSIQDIIDKEYTVSLDDFDNTSISRYKEAFKLAKDKSNYTFSQAANFAKDLLIESKVTTLIIAACKNINELENYIECLNNNQLDKFNCFKIIEK